MKEAYDTTRFGNHVSKCAGPKDQSKRGRRPQCGVLTAEPNQVGALDAWVSGKTSNIRSELKDEDSERIPALPLPQLKTQSLKAMAQKLGWKAKPLKSFEQSPSESASDGSGQPNGPVPCGGITKDHDERVPQYLRRPVAAGGGARSRKTIAEEEFGQAYSQLSQGQKTSVDTIRQHNYTWRNDRSNVRIFSTSCRKSMYCPQDLDSSSRVPPLCNDCSDLLRSKAFKNALRVPLKSDENLKFTNKTYIPESEAKIYARCKGLRSLIEDNVSLLLVFNMRFPANDVK